MYSISPGAGVVFSFRALLHKKRPRMRASGAFFMKVRSGGRILVLLFVRVVPGTVPPVLAPPGAA